jgi:hypothetical protein
MLCREAHVKAVRGAPGAGREGVAEAPPEEVTG